MNNIIIKAFIAVACDPNIISNTHNIGRDIYHQLVEKSHVVAKIIHLSIIGKFNNADMNTISNTICFTNVFIKYPLIRIIIPVIKHKAKNTFNHVYQKAMLA